MQHSFAAGALAAVPYCVPGASCFPSTAELGHFNATIGGRLLAPLPYAAVCYAGTWDAAQCATLVANQTVSAFRDELPTAAMFINLELGPNQSGCPTPSMVPAAPGIVGETCQLGAQAAYEVNATSAHDISLAVKFAAKHRLRLRIKNTGHDYTGRSLAPGSFTIWTHHLKDQTYDPEFVPAGCDTASLGAFEVGSGVQVGELYVLADKHNVTVAAGFESTVGAAGGYVIGGGGGPLGPTLGLGVDNLLQTETVMADGSIVLANECQNSDLFWALRGGGGTFGVNSRVWFKSHPAFTAVNAVGGELLVSTPAQWDALVSAWMHLQPALAAAGWGGISELSYPTAAFVFAQPGLASAPPLKNISDAIKILDNVTALASITPQLSSAQFPTWYTAYNTLISPIITPSSVVGVNLLDMSRIMPAALFADDAAMSDFASWTLALPAKVPVILQLVGGGAVNNVSTHATSVNPAWRDSIGYLDVPVFGTNATVTAAQIATQESLTNALDAVLRKHDLPVAAYYNEQTLQAKNWKQLSWGASYSRLAHIKRKVDPRGVFSCQYCVLSDVIGW